MSSGGGWGAVTFSVGGRDERKAVPGLGPRGSQLRLCKTLMVRTVTEHSLCGPAQVESVTSRRLQVGDWVTEKLHNS